MKITQARINNVVSYLEKAHNLTRAQAETVAEKGSYSFVECDDIARAMDKPAVKIDFFSDRLKDLAERHPNVMIAEISHAEIVAQIEYVREQLRTLRANGCTLPEQKPLKQHLLELREDRRAAVDRLALARQHALLHPEDADKVTA